MVGSIIVPLPNAVVFVLTSYKVGVGFLLVYTKWYITGTLYPSTQCVGQVPSGGPRKFISEINWK